MSKEIVLDDYAFLVSETDEKGIIIFANDDFCKIAGYGIDELIGKPHNTVTHPDMPKAAFKDLWETVKKVISGQDTLKMQLKMEITIGYLQQFIQQLQVKEQRDIYLVEEKLALKR